MPSHFVASSLDITTSSTPDISLVLQPPMVFEEVVKDRRVYVISPRPLVLHGVEEEVRVRDISPFQPLGVICAGHSVAPHA